MLFWILIVATIIVLSFVYGALSAAPWMPMRQSDTIRVLEIIKKLPPGSKIYELGSGDGRMLSVLSAGGYRAIGFEISLLPFFLAWVRKIFTRNFFKINYYSFWPVSIASADAVFFFLLPNIMPKIRAKLERELRPGTLVISYTFSIPGWAPIIVDEAPRAPKIFVYE